MHNLCYYISYILISCKSKSMCVCVTVSKDRSGQGKKDLGKRWRPGHHAFSLESEHHVMP